ncbi:MAG TPA: serine protease [Pirellulales bacterium]|nr:serine protease [Pirellulales bacterium]
MRNRLLNRLIALHVAPLAWLCLAAIGHSVRAEGDFNLAEARKSVVFIRRITPGRETALGSGFLTSADGLIYTSRHVIEPADLTAKGTLVLVGVPSKADPDDLDWFPAVTAYSPDDENLDFAILKIAARAEYGPFTPLPLSFDKLELGAGVAVIGYPYIRENEAVLSFNKGSISATRVRFNGRGYYQTDAAVNHGNSGGPLLNEKGEAVGIVTLKEVNAENVGFALYLSEIRGVSMLAAERLAALRPQAGPIDLRQLRLPTTIHPRTANWEINEGRPREEKGELVLDDHGGPYWVSSRQPLPDDFQLVISCALEYLQGSQKIEPGKRTSLRNLYVRFDAPSTKSPIWEPTGYLVRFGHQSLALFKNEKLVKSVPEGNPQGKPFRLSITKQGADIEIAVDGKALLEYHDPRPLGGGARFSIGGYLSRLHLGEVAAIQLDGASSPPGQGPQSKTEQTHSLENAERR